MNIAAGNLNYAGTAVTATGAELNLIDGGATPASVTLASGDGLLVNDSGTMKLAQVGDIDTFVSATTATLTNKTLTAPKFADGGFLADDAGNEVLIMNKTVTAVNALAVTNSATNNAVVVSAEGADANIDIDLTPKGTGEVNIAAGNLNYAGTAVSATGAELNYLAITTLGTSEDSKVLTQSAAGVVTMSAKTIIQTHASPVAAGDGFDATNVLTWVPRRTFGNTFVTQLMIDLTSDIGCGSGVNTVLGKSAAPAPPATGAAYLTQVTAIFLGTIMSMKVECIQQPDGTNITDDLDFWESSEAAKVKGASVTADANNANLITAGSAWVPGDVSWATSVTADRYLYMTCGSGLHSGGAFSAGKFIVTFYGK